MPSSEIPPGSPSEPPRGFGLGAAMAVVVSSMIGGGILTTSGIAVAEVGSHGVMLALWMVGGLVALCGALTLAELAAALPRSGGEYAILTEAYGPLAGFLGGWVSLLMGFAAPIAASAAASARYLASPLAGEPSIARERLIASLAIVVFAAIQMRGQRLAGRLQTAITTVKVVALVLFVAVGLAAGLPRSAPIRFEAASPVKAIFSLVYISYAYTGWNGAAYIAGEVGDPRRRLPLALLFGTGLVMVLYLGVNLVYAVAVPAADLVALARGPQGTSAVEPIAEIASARLFGDVWAGRLSVAFGGLLLGSLGALLLTGARVAFAMARAGQFPRFAGQLSGRGQAPAAASLTLAGTSILLLWSGRFEQLIVYSGVGLALFSLLTVAAVYVLRMRQPRLHRPFRTPLYPILPAIYLGATVILSAAAFAERPVESRFALASILAGVPVYYLSVIKSPKP